MMQVCPVCEGRRIVPLGFYSLADSPFRTTATAEASESCRSCAGTGVILSDAPPQPIPFTRCDELAREYSYEVRFP